MKKFALAVLFSLAGLAGFGELAGLPGVVKHKYIEPGTYVSTDTWMTVSGRVDGVATKRANDAAKKYASTSCARILPPYLHEVSFDDVYPDDAAWFYQQVGHAYTGHCSARRNGNVLERNFDWKFDEAPTFVVRVSAAAGRFASLGVATIGDLVTEGQVNSHQWFPYFRCLPGHTVDGVNERGVVCEVNVTDGTWPRTEGEIHGLGAVRWALDYGTNAQQVAEYLAEHVYLPEGFGGNLHWIVADATSTYIVEDGEAIPMTEQPVVMTNFSQDRTGGEGYERWSSLTNLATTIESQWWTKAYDRDTRPIRLTDLGPDYEQIWTYWAQYPKELHRNQKIGGIGWWQTVHTSVYDITNRVLRIAVQETDDWYTFALAKNGTDEAKVREIAGEVVAPVAAAVSGLQSSVSGLQSSKADRSTTYTKDEVDETIRTVYSDMDAYDEDVKAELRGEIDDVRAEAETAFDEAYDARETAVSALTKAETLQSSKLNKSDVIDPASATTTGKAADALNVKQALAGKLDLSGGTITGVLNVGDGTHIYDGTIILDYNEYFQLQDYCIQREDEDGNNIEILFPRKDGTFALLSDIDHTSTRFSNEVLAVGIDTNVLAAVAASTNAVAQIGEFYAAFSDIGLTPTQGGMTLAGLLAALVAAVTWLKKVLGKVADNSGKPTDDFATNILGKQVANAKVRYALATTASATMTDRTVNLYEMNGNGTITFPTATTHEGVTYARDFLLRVKVTTAGSLTLPTDVTPLGDSFDFTKANDWLIAFTEIGKDANNKAEFYIRAISLEG